MSGVSPSRRFGQNVLVGVLCLLAFLFAVEAKLAWYGPVYGPGCDVRAAKACPVDAPKVVGHGISSPNSAHCLISFALVIVFAVASTMQMNLLLGRNLEGKPQQASLVAFSSTNLFFRPPPTL
jgi:hypothetical protein